MKNSVILTALLSMAAVGAQAQQSQGGDMNKAAEPDTKPIISGSAKVQVNVNFTPVLQIELGSGAKGKGVDMVNLAYNSVESYKNGVSLSVPKQLKVFAIGGSYAVNAEIKPGSGSESILQLLQLGVGAKDPAKKDASAKSTVYTDSGKGYQELDVVYAVKPLVADNLALFNELMKDGTVKKHTVDITYTIAAK